MTGEGTGGRGRRGGGEEGVSPIWPLNKWTDGRQAFLNKMHARRVQRGAETNKVYFDKCVL